MSKNLAHPAIIQSVNEHNLTWQQWLDLNEAVPANGPITELWDSIINRYHQIRESQMKIPSPKELGYTNSPFSNSNTLMDHVRELNKKELQEQEVRRQRALNRIKELREAIQAQRQLSDNTPQ